MIRGNGPLVSLIIPSRDRFEHLSDTIRSCYENASDPSRIEYVIKFDTDDVDMIRRIPELPEYYRSRFIISERLRGYYDLHVFVNDLCRIARGDWVWLMNDDARMVTKGWDDILANFDPSVVPGFKGSNDVCLLNPGSPSADATDVFPMVRRAAVERMGHFSAHCHNDTYAQIIYMDIGAMVRCPDIKVLHLIHSMTDATHSHSAGAQGNSFEDFHSSEQAAYRERDKAILLDMLA